MAPLSIERCHWYVGTVPVAVTLKFAAAGATMLCAAGCTVRVGATIAGVTVNCTAELVTLMPAAVTMTR